MKKINEMFKTMIKSISKFRIYLFCAFESFNWEQYEIVYLKFSQIKNCTLVRMGHKRDFADIVKWSCGGGKNLGLKIGGVGGVGRSRLAPPRSASGGC